MVKGKGNDKKNDEIILENSHYLETKNFFMNRL